jgi:hypothetical protein
MFSMVRSESTSKGAHSMARVLILEPSVIGHVQNEFGNVSSDAITPGLRRVIVTARNEKFLPLSREELMS